MYSMQLMLSIALSVLNPYNNSYMHIPVVKIKTYLTFFFLFNKSFNLDTNHSRKKVSWNFPFMQTVKMNQFLITFSDDGSVLNVSIRSYNYKPLR